MPTLHAMLPPFTPSRFQSTTIFFLFSGVIIFPHPPTLTRLVNSRPQSTGRLCSVGRQLRPAAAATTRSRCPAPRATPSPSTTRPPLLILDQTSTTGTPLPGPPASHRTRIGRPYLLLRGHPLFLPLLLVNSFSRSPPQRYSTKINLPP